MLPTEIYLEILDLIQPDDELSPKKCKALLFSFSLVCKAFRTALTQRIFRTFVLELTPPSMRFDRTTRTWQSQPVEHDAQRTFLEELVEGNSLTRKIASYIKDLKISGWCLPKGDVELAIGCLEWLPNLRSLRLFGMEIPTSRISSLSSLKLAQLTLDRVRTDGDCSMTELGSAYYTDLRVHGTGLPWWNPGDDAKSLLHPDIQGISTNSPHFLETVFTFTPPITLQKLHLQSVVDWETVQTFLLDTPGQTIQELRVDGLFYNGETEIFYAMLQKVPLPNLQTLFCPAVIAPFIASASPALRVLNITSRVKALVPNDQTEFPPITTDDLKDFTHPHLRVAQLPFAFHDLLQLSKTSPQLDTLHLHYIRDMSYDEENAIVIMGRLLVEMLDRPASNVTSLHLHLPISPQQIVDLSFQLRWLTHEVLQDQYPRLIHVSFSNSGVGWRRAVEDDEWIPYVRHDWKTYLRRSLTQVKYVDHKDCFRRLVEDGEDDDDGSDC